MKGKVLAIPENDKKGIIVDAESNRYKFTIDAFKIEGMPRSGQSVDFDVENGEAVDIYADGIFPTNEGNFNPHTASNTRVPLKKLWFSASGRASRYDYLVRTMLPILGVSLVALIIDLAMGNEGAEDVEGPVFLLSLLCMFWTYVVIMIKRCRDIDLNPWFLLLGIIPILSFIFSLFLIFKKGTIGENRYGLDPVVSDV